MRKLICFICLLFTVSCTSVPKSELTFNEATDFFNNQEFSTVILDYVGDNYLIFHTVDLLVVYDIKDKKFDSAINLSKYDAGHIQGSINTGFSVSKDGTEVFFKNYEGVETPVNERKVYDLYHYDVVNRQITTIENGEIDDINNIYYDFIYNIDYFTKFKEYFENPVNERKVYDGYHYDGANKQITTIENGEIDNINNIYDDYIYDIDYSTTFIEYDENHLMSDTLCRGKENQYLALDYKKQDLESMSLVTYENQEIVNSIKLFK